MTVPLGKDIDDDLAVVYADMDEGVKIASLTATFGNAAIKETCAAARRLTRRLNRTWPVSCGTGFLSDYRQQPVSGAVRQLIDVTMAQPQGTRVTWVAQGALTNVAGALFHGGQPVAERIGRLVIMGGSNTTGDLNTLADLHAARFVLAYPMLNRTLVTMQTCQWAVVEAKRDIERLADCPGSYAYEHLARIRRHAKLMGMANEILFGPSPLGDLPSHGFYPWDVVAMSAAVDGFKYFSGLECVRATLEGVRLVTHPVECESPEASYIPHRFTRRPMIETLISRLCSAGVQGLARDAPVAATVL